MSLASVRTNITQTLDILLHLTTQTTFHDVIRVNDLVDLCDLLFGQFVRPDIAINLSFRQQVGGKLRTDPVNVLQCVQDLLAIGDIITRNSWHD